MCDMKTTILFPAGFGNAIEFCSANNVVHFGISKFKCSYILGYSLKEWQKDGKKSPGSMHSC